MTRSSGVKAKVLWIIDGGGVTGVARAKRRSAKQCRARRTHLLDMLEEIVLLASYRYFAVGAFVSALDSQSVRESVRG
jgi:hypothetical protein